MRLELKRKVPIECKIPQEHGGYDSFCKTEIKQLTSSEAVRQWAREQRLDTAVPRSLHLAECMELLMKNFNISREPAYRRAIMAVHEFECLSFEDYGKFKYISYKPTLDKPKEGTEEEEQESERGYTMCSYERSLREMDKRGELTPPIHAQPESTKDEAIDIYALLVAHGKKRKGETGKST